MQEAAEAVAPDQVSVWAAASLVVEARARVARVPAEARVVAEVQAAPAVPAAAVVQLMQGIYGAPRQGRAAVAAPELAEECREVAELAARAVSGGQEVVPEGVQVEVAELAGQVAPEVQE
jgi:hypothetical protein